MSFCPILGISGEETTDKFVLKIVIIMYNFLFFLSFFQILNSCWMKIIVQYQCLFMLLQAIRVEVLLQTELKTKKDTGGAVYFLFFQVMECFRTLCFTS